MALPARLNKKEKLYVTHNIFLVQEVTVSASAVGYMETINML